MRTFFCGAGLLAFALLACWSRSDDEQDHESLDWVEALGLTGASLVVAIGWMAVVLASLGRFSLRNLGVFCVIAAVIPAFAGRQRKRFHLRAPGRCEVLLAALLTACGFVYLRPHEYVLGGVDAGTYTNVAATISRTGGLVVHDDWVALVAAHGDDSLRSVPANLLPRQIQFVGWYVDDAEPARVLPQFLPFHPALLAVGISSIGLPRALLLPPLYALLGLTVFYLSVRRLFGGGTALLATTILAATPTEIFFSRYPTAESLTQLLVFSGLLAYQHLRDGEGRSLAFGILGGAAFGAATLTRIDLPLVIALVVAALVLEWSRGSWQRGWGAFTAVLGLFGLHMVFHFWRFAWPYVWNVYEGPAHAIARSVAGSREVVYAFGIALAFASLAAIRFRRHLTFAMDPGITRRLRIALAASVVIASAYAYFLRPVLEPPRMTTTWPSLNTFPILDGQNWVRMGWYLTPLGLVLATLGLATLLLRESLARIGLFVAVGAATTAQFVWRIMTTPYHIYAMRRFVPIAIPALAVFAAVALSTVARSRRLPRARGVAALLAIALLGGISYQSRYVLTQRDLAGAWAQLSALNQSLQPRSVVLVTEPPTLVLADTFGPPLRYVFDHPVVVLRRDSPRVLALLEQVMTRAAAENRAVQLIAVDPIFRVVRDHYALRAVGEVPVSVSQLMNTFDGFPSTTQTATYNLEVYDVLSALERPLPSPDIVVDVGTLDTRFLRGGFYYKETPPGQPSARWAGAAGAIDLPLETQGPVEVEIRARIFDVPGVQPPRVEVWLDQHVIGSFQAQTDWQVFRVSGIARPTNGTSLLLLSSPTFNPTRVGLNSDTRDLGLYVDWVKVNKR